MSSADCSKKETTVLSEQRKIETCSTATANCFDRSEECSSIYSVLSSLVPGKMLVYEDISIWSVTTVPRCVPDYF